MEQKTTSDDKFSDEGESVALLLSSTSCWDIVSPKRSIEEFIKKIRTVADQDFDKAVAFSKFILEKDKREKFLDFVEDQRKLPVEMYVHPMTDPFLALRQYIKLYLVKKIKKEPKEILGTYIRKVMSFCKVRGHSYSTGFDFRCTLKDKIEGIPLERDHFSGCYKCGLYLTFDRKLIFDLKPSSHEYLSMYVLDAEVIIGLHRGGWSCG